MLFLQRALSCLRDGHLLPVSSCGLPCVSPKSLLPGLEPTLITSFYINYFFKVSVSIYSHFVRFWGSGLQHITFEGVQLSPKQMVSVTLVKLALTAKSDSVQCDIFESSKERIK